MLELMDSEDLVVGFGVEKNGLLVAMEVSRGYQLRLDRGFYGLV